MDKKKIVEMLKNPHGVWLVLPYVITLAASVGAILMLVYDVLNSPYSLFSYIVFAIAAIGLGFSVYTAVKGAPHFKGWLIGVLNSNRFTHTLIENYSFRTVAFAAVGFFMSLAYSAFNAVLGIAYSSIWYGALAAYHIVIALVRGRTVFSHVSTARALGEGTELTRVKNYRNTGVFMLILNIALSSAIAQMIFDNRFFDYPDFTVYAYAAYAFYKIVMAVINIIKSRRGDELTVHAIRDINLIDALVSMLALQTALLHTFSGDGVDVSVFNTLTGSAVSIAAIALSVFMIAKGNARIERIKCEDIKNGR